MSLAHHRLPIAALALLLVAAHAANAQAAPREVRSSVNTWLDVATDLWLTTATDLQLGAKVQRADRGAAPQQVELRVGLQRPMGPRFRVAGGGVYVHNSPAGAFPAAAPYDERRLWQHVLQEQHLGRVALQHRYRLEERWIEHPPPSGVGVAGDPDVSFAMRARYQLRATTSLGHGARGHLPYVTAYDELLKSVGPHASRNVVDQNRAYAGVGVRWSRALRGELGYVNQRIVRANGQQLEHAHVVQLSLAFTREAHG